MKSVLGKKNPLLSLYLSGTNAVLGAARSRASAEFKRQTALAVSRGAKQMADFWSGALLGPAPKKKRRKAR